MKSIGMVVPLVSLVLILRVWRTLGWESDGNWWGLPLLLFAMAAAQLQQRAILILVVTPTWSTVLPPPSLVVLAYGAGIVLLLGGPRLFRAALFPILLLWFVNPIPRVFSVWVDLPLQYASAHIARAFAMHLGHPLTPDHLRLMFTPEFGMFIAPGCNGIRGSVTMGFIALIAGYIYRFRWYASALAVTGAVLLGYLFNLLRLCLLVLYYVVALHFPSLQNKAENADYVIGAALFFLASFLLFAVIHSRRDGRNSNGLEASAVPENGGLQCRESRRSQYGRLAIIGAAALLGWIGLARAQEARPTRITDASVSRFPHRLGSYTLVRSWDESVVGGQVVYLWGQYAPVNGGAPVAIGVSPLLGWHDPLICHFIRGEHPLWQGQLTFATAGAVPISFSSAFYTDGVTQHLEAATECSGASCGEFATQRTHFGFIFTRLDTESLLSQRPQRPIPILLRAETIDMAMPADAARKELTGDLQAFLGSVQVDDLTRPYR
jgi:exosortase J